MIEAPKHLRRIMKERTLSLLDAIVAAIVFAIWHYLREFSGPVFGEFPNMSLIILLILTFVLSSFLALYVYKFYVVNKALLQINPHFYEEREFGKWFDYYAD